MLVIDYDLLTLGFDGGLYHGRAAINIMLIGNIEYHGHDNKGGVYSTNWTLPVGEYETQLN